MATIDLGRIKFKWQGAYNGATAYVVDDVVESGGNSYVCIAASTGNTPPNATYWELMSQKGVDADLFNISGTVQGDIYYNNGSAIARLAPGTSGQLLQSGGTGANVSWTDAPAGITNAQQWRPTTSTTGAGTVVNSWEKTDTNSPGYIGSDMTLTNSNEWFNFPETGIWWIYMRACMYITGGSSEYLGVSIQASTNSGSTWNDASISWDSGHINSAYVTVSVSFMFDVTNTSTHLIRVKNASTQNNTPVMVGNSTQNESEITFVRLGDT
jgi:hypothetical protein